MATIAATDETFVSEVLDSDRPVLVDFWATWCAPCRMVAPVLEELSEELKDVLKIVKVDVDQSPGVSGQLRVQSIPTLMLFRDGTPVKATAGALPKPQLLALLEGWLPELAGPMIGDEALSQRMADGHAIQLIDIRREQDFARSHLRGAQCVAPDNVRAFIDEHGRDQRYVLICRTGEDSKELAKTLSVEGYPVQALTKGLLEWEGNGHPTYSNREEQQLAEG